jgi:hypothetical protein
MIQRNSSELFFISLTWFLSWIAELGRPICNEDDLDPYLPEEPKQKLSLLEKVREGMTWTRIVALGLPSIIEFEAQDRWVLSVSSLPYST